MAKTTLRSFPQAHVLLILALALWFSSPFSLNLRAQSTAALKGTVTDPSGAVVPKAKVVVRNEGTGVQTETQTDDAGQYLVPALPVGAYRVEASAPGFQTTVLTGLRLDVSGTVIAGVKLQVGATTQQVTISEEPPVIEASTMTVGQTILQRTVQEIPLNGRHFVELTMLSPGTVTPPQNGFLTAPLRGQGSFGVNTAGLREDMVNYMINGINLSDQLQNQITFQPSINTVEEFKIDNSTFSAEYGRNAGAIINIATRSGTNNFHGELFEFIRNDTLDAKNFFTFAPATKPPFKRNNFGADLGGPLLKNKAFFFASYEGLRQRQGISVTTDVPTDAQRTAVTDPVVQKLLPLIPHANGFDAGGNPAFNGAVSAPVQIDQGTADLQFNLTSADRLHGYMALQEDTRQEPTLSGNSIPGFGDTRHARRQLVTLNEVHIFGPNLTNEARAGYNRIHILFTPNQLLNPADFGIANGINAPIGLPQIIVGVNLVPGFLNFGGELNLPSGRGDTTGVFSDTLHWLRGRHSFAFGGEVRRFFNNNIAENDGSYVFANLANFLSDRANRFTVTIGAANNRIVQGAWGFFLQDSFKWKPSFTLELGLRYDYNASPTEAQNRFSVFVPATDSLVQVGTNGITQVYRTNNKNVQPRLGFAWDPFKNGTTVVRAGYAILTDQPVTNAVTPLSANPPFAVPVSVAAANTLTFTNTGTASASSVAPAAINPDFQNAYVQSWNLNIQHEISPTLAVMVGYFGSKGTHLRILRNINQKGTGARPFVALSPTGPISPGALLGTNLPEVDSGSNSNYNALWLTFTKRLSHNFQFDTSYTYSKSLDDNSLTSVNAPGVQDSFNIRGDYGPSDFDARHRVVFSGIYDLPFKGHRVSEGWELGLIFTAQSGNPLNIITSDTSFTGNQTVRPDVSGPIVTTGNPNQWFANPTVFVFPGAGSTVTHFGNLSRNAVTGPDVINADFSIIKTTKLTETTSLQFRTEAFDILNHPNFGNPGRVVGTTTFGVISNTRVPTGDFGSSRQIQFALKFLF